MRTPGVVPSYFVNSLKQLSDIQQRQCGLIIGAAVADAAVHRCTDTFSDLNAPSSIHRDAALFSNRGAHSTAYQYFIEYVAAMSKARGAAFDEVISGLWRTKTARSGVEVSAMLRCACGVLAAPCQYPWADDDVLHAFVEPVLSSMPFGFLDRKRLAIINAIVSVALRYLQSNPSPMVNTMLVSPAEVQVVFPSSSCEPCFRNIEEGEDKRSILILKEALSIASRAKCYEDGIRECATRDTAESSARALIVGGLLGAKKTVRAIPPEWMSATSDHAFVTSMAIEIAQWAWNPPTNEVLE